MSRCGSSAARRRQAVKEIARLEQRRVERLAVEADERAGARELVGDRASSVRSSA